MENNKNIEKVIEVYSSLIKDWRKHLKGSIDEIYNLDTGDAPRHALAIQCSNIDHIMNISPFLLKMEMELRSSPNKLKEVQEVFEAIIVTYDELELEIKLFQSKGFPYWSSEMYGVIFGPQTNLFDDIINVVKAIKSKYQLDLKSMDSSSQNNKEINKLSDFLKPDYRYLSDLLKKEFYNLSAIDMFHMLMALNNLGYLIDRALLPGNIRTLWRALQTSLGFTQTYEALLKNLNNKKEPDEFKISLSKDKIQNLIPKSNKVK